MNKIERSIDDSIFNYPSLYWSNNPFLTRNRVLDHYFFTLGNGISNALLFGQDEEDDQEGENHQERRREPKEAFYGSGKWAEFDTHRSFYLTDTLDPHPAEKMLDTIRRSFEVLDSEGPKPLPHNYFHMKTTRQLIALYIERELSEKMREWRENRPSRNPQCQAMIEKRDKEALESDNAPLAKLRALRRQSVAEEPPIEDEATRKELVFYSRCASIIAIYGNGELNAADFTNIFTWDEINKINRAAEEQASPSSVRFLRNEFKDRLNYGLKYPWYPSRADDTFIKWDSIVLYNKNTGKPYTISDDFKWTMIEALYYASQSNFVCSSFPNDADYMERESQQGPSREAHARLLLSKVGVQEPKPLYHIIVWCDANSSHYYYSSTKAQKNLFNGFKKIIGDSTHNAHARMSILYNSVGLRTFDKKIYEECLKLAQNMKNSYSWAFNLELNWSNT